jgi:hypothetical protein
VQDGFLGGAQRNPGLEGTGCAHWGQVEPSRSSGCPHWRATRSLSYPSPTMKPAAQTGCFLLACLFEYMF